MFPRWFSFCVYRHICDRRGGGEVQKNRNVFFQDLVRRCIIQSAFCLLTPCGKTSPLQCLLWFFSEIPSRVPPPPKFTSHSDIRGCLMPLKTRTLVDKEVIRVSGREQQICYEAQSGRKTKKIYVGGLSLQQQQHLSASQATPSVRSGDIWDASEVLRKAHFSTPSSEHSACFQLPNPSTPATAAAMDVCPPTTSKNAPFVHCEYWVSELQVYTDMIIPKIHF